MLEGTRVADRYVLLALAGTGAMGTVYRAWDSRTDQDVAIKLMRDPDRRMEERFAREAAVLAELGHPGLVRYVDHGTTAHTGVQFLAMEWLEGETLEQRLRSDRPLAVWESLAMLGAATEALAVAHQRGVIHRDLKPSNVFLVGGRADRVKVLDFGVASWARDPARLTRTGNIVGTPAYMAPEQARGDGDVTARADVFALGCIAFECLTGRAAFPGEHAMAVLAKILLEDPPALATLRPDLPAGLCALVDRLLSKEPAERPADAADVLLLLGQLDSVQGAAPPPVSATHRALTDSEQRVVTVVLAAAPGARDAADLDRTIDQADLAAELGWLRQVLRPYQARLYRLLDGSVAAMLTSTGGLTDQAVRAGRCALAMRALLGDARLAVATGRGLLDDPLPVGEVIDWAARATQDLAPGQVGIDDVTAALLGGRFEVREAPGLLLLEHERDAVGPARTLLGRRLACVGRDRELALLETSWRLAVSLPAAAVVLVTGASGMGKSRLVAELLSKLLQSAQPGDAVPHVLFARGDSLSAGSAFGLLGPLIRRAAELAPGEPRSMQRKKLRDRLATRLPAGRARSAACFLGEVCGVPFEAEDDLELEAARSDAQLLGDRVREAWVEWLAAETSHHPVVLVLEDAHWGDAPSLDLVDEALRRLADRPLLVLAVARPEIRQRFPRLFEQRDATELTLGPLSPRAAQLLARTVLGGAADEALLDKLLDRAGGNPFYLEELLRAAAAGRGAALPDTVIGMVQARLDALDPEARRVLRAASVFGRRFWASGVAHLLGNQPDPERVHAWMAHLADLELVAASGRGGMGGEQEYVFRQALYHEAAYALLTQRDRELGHRLAAEWLEAAGACDPLVQAEHLERGRRPQEAAIWHARAAGEALAGNDLEAALEHAARGRACEPPRELLGRLQLVAAAAHRWRGELEAATAAGQEAIDCLPPGTGEWFQALGELITASSRLGRDERLSQWVDQLCQVPARDDAAHRARVENVCQVAGQLMGAGRIGLANALVDLAESQAGVQKSHPLVAARLLRARAKAMLHAGFLPRAAALYRLSAEAFDRAGDVRNACVQRVNAGFAELMLGQHRQAERSLRQSLVAADRAGLSYIGAFARHNLGLALGRLGRLDEALDVERRAAAWLEAHGDAELGGGSRLYVALILLDRGQPGEAEAEARAAVAQLERFPAGCAHALAVLAEVQLALGRTAEALENARRASRLLPPDARCEEGQTLVQLALARALAASGDTPAARAALTVGLERLRTAAQAIPDGPDRRTFLDCVPDNARLLKLADEWGLPHDAR